MCRFKVSKTLLFCILLIWLSVLLALISIFPIVTPDLKTNIVIEKSFNLTQSETLRYGLGSFSGGENVSVYVRKVPYFPLNFSIITYSNIFYSNSKNADIVFSFVADTNYYEALFFSSSNEIITIQFEVSVEQNQIYFPFTSFNIVAKVMFLSSIVSVFLIILKSNFLSSSKYALVEKKTRRLTHRSNWMLIFLILLSLSFWFAVILINTNSHASFENWYTDHARHPYSSTLFTEYGFSIFNTPLGDLANIDASYYKFVTWPQMPHLYPLGSVLLFLPFAFLLQNGVNQILVFKMEIIVLLLFSHIGLYLFFKRFWNKKLFLLLKLIGIYAVYIPLIVYSANGMFDSIPFLFSLIAIDLFLTKKYDFFLFFIAISSIFKYQPLLFLFPLVIVALLKLLQKYSLKMIVKNKAVIAGIILMASTVFTAVLNAPFLFDSNNISVMNGINAFNLHSQIPWIVQSLAVLSTLTITLLFSIYFLDKNPIISLSSIFILIPSFFLIYFQIWYLPFFFVYSLIPWKKREVDLTLIWILFIVTMLSFGTLSFNPLNVLNGWIQVLGF
jgi:hypothetical protein